MKLYVICIFLLLCGCRTEVKQALKNTDGNRIELCKVFLYYRYIDRDVEKYNAALFLIENLKYHASRGKIIEVNPEIEAWRLATDSIYYSITKDSMLNNYPRNTLKQIQRVRQKELDSIVIPEVNVDNSSHLDCHTLSSEFLINHIDHAFKVWKESKFARDLSFDEFKEYILPYRSIAGYGFHKSGDEFYDIFAKYVLADTSSSLHDHIARYNMAVSGMRNLNGKIKRKGAGGIYDLYGRGFHDCVDEASYGCNILRSCGIPTVVEYNASYLSLSGRHFHCSIYTPEKEWECFNPETGLPQKWGLRHCSNIYRAVFGAQKNTPFFLKSEGEYVPDLLNKPCIQDVTSRYKPVVSIELPFSVETSNRLAYLGTFHRGHDGLLPVTWGEVDSVARKVYFKNVIPEIVYFPIYYLDTEFEAFGEPFYVKLDSGKMSLHLISEVADQNDSLSTLLINRKYPRKPDMVKAAQNMVGGIWYGSQYKDGRDKVKLAEINFVPEPYLQEIRIKKPAAYQFYFYESREGTSTKLGEVEFLTDARFKYENVKAATSLPIHSRLKIDSSPKKRIQLLPSDTKGREFDGNQQTARNGKRFLYTFPQKQIITSIVFAPISAENGIIPGNNYQLFQWDNKWTEIADINSEYHFLEFKQLDTHKLYWLRNNSKGKEEMPFVIVNNRPKFIYGEYLNP